MRRLSLAFSLAIKNGCIRTRGFDTAAAGILFSLFIALIGALCRQYGGRILI